MSFQNTVEEEQSLTPQMRGVTINDKTAESQIEVMILCQHKSNGNARNQPQRGHSPRFN